MNMNKDAIKIILPLAAFLVIIQAIFIMDVFGLKKTVTKTLNVPELNPQPSVVVEPVVEKKVKLQLVGPASMQVGKKYEVQLMATSTEKVPLISLETYVNFAPEMVKVSNLLTGKDLDKPSFSTINQEKGVVVANVLQSKPVELMPEVGMILQSFSISPSKSGNLVFSIDAGDGKSLLVSGADSKVVGFSVENLNVVVSK